MPAKRISEHPVLEFQRGEKFFFDFEGKKIPAYPGDTIAAALYAQGLQKFTESKLLKRPRGFFCAIGKCSSCIMRVNGVPHVRSCITLAEEGMKVERQSAMPDFPDVALPCTPVNEHKIEIAVIGGGPAGLSAAIVAANNGADVHLFDENANLGGQLVKQTHQFFGRYEEHAGTRGVDIGKALAEEAHEAGVKIHSDSTVLGYYPEMTVTVDSSNSLEIYRCKGIVYATGATENFLAFENNDLPGIYGAGGVQTLMNEYGVTPGDKVLMIGAGNVGLIVSYQLIQAGVEVVEVLEALPKVGGYQVHASKLRRAGVPISTRHSIIKAIGTEKVEGAVVQGLDDDWKPIDGTERTVECDIICIAVGLQPDNHFLRLAGCETKHVPELGGIVPLRNEYLETTVSNLFIAGDSAGIEEATVAILEGKLAGAAITEKIKGPSSELTTIKEKAILGINDMREGPYGKRSKKGVNLCTFEGGCIG